MLSETQKIYVKGSVWVRDDVQYHPAPVLAAHLKDRLPYRRMEALFQLAEVLPAICQAESALHRKIALHFSLTASLDSRTRVVAQVTHDLQFTLQDVLNVLFHLLPGCRVLVG